MDADHDDDDADAQPRPNPHHATHPARPFVCAAQFHELWQKLKSRPELKGVSFPGKSLGRLTLAQQEKRRDALDRFMIDVTSMMRLSSGTMAELNAFMDVGLQHRAGKR